MKQHDRWDALAILIPVLSSLLAASTSITPQLWAPYLAQFDKQSGAASEFKPR
jgi:hypothetical protein